MTEQNADDRNRADASGRADEPAPQALGIDRAMLDQAIGGWRGMIDSGLPAGVFVIAYIMSGQQLRLSLIAAVVTGGLIALFRVVRREPLQQVLAGFFGVAISAFVASRTGRAENFFLLGIVINIAYLAAYVTASLLRWPLLGLIIGYFRGDPTGWRSDPRQYRAYATASWIWAGMFTIRLSVQLPMYFAGASAVGMLGTAKIVMGWPLFLLAAYLSYLIIHPAVRDADARAARPATAELEADSA